MPVAPDARERRTDSILQFSSFIFSTIKTASSAAPIPGVQLVASIGLSIIETIQGVRSNKEACRRLSDDVGEVLCAIIRTVDEDQGRGVAISSHLTRDLETLASKLSAIEQFLQKHSKRNRFLHLIFYQQTEGEIKEHVQSVRSALTLFGFHSQVEVRVRLGEILAAQTRLLEREEQETIPAHPSDLVGPTRPTTPTHVPRPASQSYDNTLHAPQSPQTPPPEPRRPSAQSDRPNRLDIDPPRPAPAPVQPGASFMNGASFVGANNVVINNIVGNQILGPSAMRTPFISVPV